MYKKLDNTHSCKKKSDDEIEQVNDAQWTQVQKVRTSKGPRKNGKEKSGIGDSIIGENPPQAIDTSNGHSNQFVVLSPSKVLEEVKFQQIDGLRMENEGIVPPELASPLLSNPTKDGDVPLGDSSPPS